VLSAEPAGTAVVRKNYRK